MLTPRAAKRASSQSWIAVSPSARAVANGEDIAFAFTENGSVEVRNRDWRHRLAITSPTSR